MTNIAILLVLISSGFHAYWNYIIRRSENPEISTFLVSLIGGLLIFPFAIYVYITSGVPNNGWWYILATVIIHAFYFFSLSRVYVKSELSTGYPIARGSAVGLVPLLAIILINEEINFFSAISIFLIFCGVVTVGLGTIKIRNIKQNVSYLSLFYALSTGFFIALYSIVDKKAVEIIDPIIFLFFVLAPSSLSVYFFNSRVRNFKNIYSIFKKQSISLLIGGLCTLTAYLLVLNAYKISQVSYVAPFREIGIVFGVLMGYFFLNEKVSKTKISGLVFILSGAFMISIFS